MPRDPNIVDFCTMQYLFPKVEDRLIIILVLL